MSQTLVFVLLIFITLPVAAQPPIPNQGNDCPTGYYRAGDYCQPTSATSDNEAIIKHGSDCPRGFYSAGDYCKRMSSSDREAIPRNNGGKCPTGWYRAGDYCVKQ